MEREQSLHSRVLEHVGYRRGRGRLWMIVMIQEEKLCKNIIRRTGIESLTLIYQHIY